MSQGVKFSEYQAMNLGPALGQSQASNETILRKSNDNFDILENLRLQQANQLINKSNQDNVQYKTSNNLNILPSNKIQFVEGGYIQKAPHHSKSVV
mmetsp:Transcript_13362/g.22724  ORF Transcript_13362/g.22724 Transcript_13362/m.22724 type:complete len:96 (+) Transcript_13362:171-458(+)